MSKTPFSPECGWLVKDLALPKQPILYCWWFSQLPGLHDAKIAPLWKNIDCTHLRSVQKEDGQVFYALYLGKADCGSERLRWHLPNQRIGSFLRSTLRLSLCALLCNDKPIEQWADIVDDFMLKHAYLEVQVLDDINKDKLREMEADCINDLEFYYPLNIQEQRVWKKDNAFNSWLNELTHLRQQRRAAVNIYNKKPGEL